MTTDTKSQTVLFPDLFDKPLFAQFNQEQASSDGGAVLLKAAERIYGLVKATGGVTAGVTGPVTESQPSSHNPARHNRCDLILVVGG